QSVINATYHRRPLSSDGHELRLAVNYLASALLTRRLIPRLKNEVLARFVNVGSVGQAPVDVADPQLNNQGTSRGQVPVGAGPVPARPQPLTRARSCSTAQAAARRPSGSRPAYDDTASAWAGPSASCAARRARAADMVG